MAAVGAAEESPAPPPPSDKDIAEADFEQTIPASGLNQSTNSSTEKIKVAEKIKKTAYLSITVDDYKKARTEIEKIVKSGNAYIGSEDEQNSAYSISNNMVIRVINKEFDSMINNLVAVASNVNSKSVNAEDVTAQFVDIQSRLKSKKEIEKRYLDILQKAS